MITVRSLHIYPVKSCRGIDVDIAEVAATGFRYDRRWMVVGLDGVFLSQRTHPDLTRVVTRIDGGRLILDASHRSPLEVALESPTRDSRTIAIWNDTCRAATAGPAAAEWFSSLLGTPCELVRQPESEVRQVDRRYSDPGDRVAFADGFPFLMISRASVDELNGRLAVPIPADRFRANIIIEGCEAHAEDGWTTISIGEVDFRVAKPCARCVVITTDQHDGARSAEPLRTLATYRKSDGKVLFGQNLVHLGGGHVQIGDSIRVVR